MWANRFLPAATACLLVSAVVCEARANPLGLKLGEVEFLDTSVGEAVEYLRERSRELDPDGRGANLLLDPKLDRDRPVSLHLSDVSVGVALLCLVEQADFDYRRESHAFVILPDGEGMLAERDLQPLDAKAPSPQAALARDLVLDQIEFADAPLIDVLQFLSEKSRAGRTDGNGLNLVVNHRVDSELPVTLRLNSVPASFVLGRIASVTGVEIRVEPWAILVEPPGTKLNREARIEKAKQEAYAAHRKKTSGSTRRKGYAIGEDPKDPRSPVHPDYVHSTHPDRSKRTNALNNVYRWVNGKWTFVRYGSGDKNKSPLGEGEGGLVTGSLRRERE